MKNRVKNIAVGIGYLALFFGVNLKENLKMV